MKKKSSIILSVLSVFFLVTTVLSGCGTKETPSKTSDTSKSIVKVRLNEVTRSIFYAPFYAALNKGFFKEEGLDIDLTTGEGADSTLPNTQIIAIILRMYNQEFHIISSVPSPTPLK